LIIRLFAITVGTWGIVVTLIPWVLINSHRTTGVSVIISGIGLAILGLGVAVLAASRKAGCSANREPNESDPDSQDVS
jgi:F0F1-type ATP synthase assembly protein I